MTDIIRGAVGEGKALQVPWQVPWKATVSLVLTISM